MTWVKCSLKLPEKDGRYLVSESQYNWIGVCSFRNGEWDSSTVTHWMPLPEKPILEDETKEKRKLYHRKWKKENPEKVKAQKRRSYLKNNPEKPKPYNNKKEHQMLRKRLDIATCHESYLRDNLSRRFGMPSNEIPDEVVKLYKPLLKIKRFIKDKKKKNKQSTE